MWVGRPNVFLCKGLQFFRLKPKFGRFLRNVNLKQDVDGAVELGRFTFHDVQHFLAIHAMHKVHVG